MNLQHLNSNFQNSNTNKNELIPFISPPCSSSMFLWQQMYLTFCLVVATFVQLYSLILRIYTFREACEEDFRMKNLNRYQNCFGRTKNF